MSPLKKHIQSQSGFSLLELIIVSGLFGLILASILTSMILFTRTLQFSNEQLFINTEYDKLVSALEADIKQMKPKDPFNYSMNQEILFVNGKYYRIIRQGTNYYLLRGTNLATMSQFVQLRFKELQFRYRYYIKDKEITALSRPLEATPGTLKVVELVGKVIMPASKKDVEFYKSFLVEYKSEFF